MDELSRRIKALAAMTDEARSISLSIEVEKECAIDNSKTSMEDIKTVVKFSYSTGRQI